jgi:hypothetical protein
MYNWVDSLKSYSSYKYNMYLHDFRIRHSNQLWSRQKGKLLVAIWLEIDHRVLQEHKD